MHLCLGSLVQNPKGRNGSFHWISCWEQAPDQGEHRLAEQQAKSPYCQEPSLPSRRGDEVPFSQEPGSAAQNLNAFEIS